MSRRSPAPVHQRAPWRAFAVAMVTTGGCALRADNARAPPPIMLRSQRPTTVSTYPAHHGLGSLDVQWRSLSPARGLSDGVSTVL